MKRTVLCLALCAVWPAHAVNVSVSVPAANLPVCPTGDPGQYVISNGTLLCVTQGGGTAIPPGSCTLSQSPNSATNPVQPGTNVQLTMQCIAGNPATSCNWTGVASTSCIVNVTPTVTTNYKATASNAGGTSPQSNTTVNVAQSTSYCTANDLQYTITWPPSGQVLSRTSGFSNQIASFKIVVPTTFVPPLNITHLGFIALSEVPGTPTTPREITVSKNACDFQSGNYIFNGTGFASVSPSVSFTVNNPSGFGDFNLPAGGTYYFNVRNSSNGVPACSYAACDALVDFATPNRY